ncbi:MAG: hypothetical protein ACFCUG_05895 [Thiotrichales bacterium]
MPLRDLPDDLHEWIKQQAAAHHRFRELRR